jgi:hypothetical protein
VAALFGIVVAPGRHPTVDSGDVSAQRLLERYHIVE